MFYIGSFLFWLFFIVTIVLMFFPAFLIWLVTLPFDKNKRFLHLYSCFWGALYTWFNPFLKLEITGREKIDRSKAYVYCANHQSMMDIVILYRLFLHFKWVSKKEIFRVPFLGWNMRLNNYLYLDRSSPSSQIRMMKQGEDFLRRGSSLMIFPEGTRSTDGQLGKFRDGAFILAQKTESSVVPVVLKGSGEVFRDGAFFYKRVYSMSIELLDPVSPDTEVSPKALGRSIRNIMQMALGQSDE